MSVSDFEIVLDDGLRISATDDPDSGIVETFYELYDRAFVLPNEKEPITGFRSCLALNHAPAYGPLASQYGAYREIMFVAREAGDDYPVGGGNFIALAHGCPSEAAPPSHPTAHLSYIFVTPTARRRGLLDRLLSTVAPLAGSALPFLARSPLRIFIEQNDPLLLSADEYDADTSRTGLDQVDRIAIWARRGARILDFAYVQPPLSDDLLADETLALSVLDPVAPDISACVVHDHLCAFFAISVLKGRDPMTNSAAAAQLIDLRSRCSAGDRLALLDPSGWVAGDGASVRARAVVGPQAGGLRQAIRR